MTAEEQWAVEQHSHHLHLPTCPALPCHAAVAAKLSAAEKAQTVATIEGELCRLECEKAYEDWQVCSHTN